jgi:alkaline phosphatase
LEQAWRIAATSVGESAYVTHAQHAGTTYNARGHEARPPCGREEVAVKRTLLVISFAGAALVQCACAPGALEQPQATEASAVPAAPAANEWYRAGAQALAAAQARVVHEGPARNVILFVGDGMSLATVTAARILEGQLAGGTGEENSLAFERMPWIGLAKTYSVNAQVADSAATATALLSGVKTLSRVVGVDAGVTIGDCQSVAEHTVPTLLEIAEAAGRATGVVTTARITHATPASAYAHAASREYESDADLPEGASGCVDIARQLVDFPWGDGLDVALGGGRANFLPVEAPDPEDANATGARKDGRNLAQRWRERYGGGGALVWTRGQLEELELPKVEHLLGLFAPSHMRYEAERASDFGGEPSLSAMTRAAIQVLSRRGGDKGYVLLVEAGRIDHGHHAGNAFRALHDTIEYSNAVRAALEMTDEADTLVVVTADHGHVFEVGGYAVRGNPILGKVRSYGDDGAPEADYARDLLGLTYTTLSYANGPGYAGATPLQPEGSKRYPHEPETAEPSAGRPDLAGADTESAASLQESIVPLGSETHSGTDVPVYARGPGAHLLSGAYEQNYVFHVLRHALRL